MSGYSRSYKEYLGKNRCCDLRGQGPPGPVGPPGPAGIGPVGPAGINTNIFPATYISVSSTLVIPAQYNPIAYYSVTLPNAGDIISTITFGVFPTGYQAIIFVNGTNGTSSDPCIISNTITNVNTNMSVSLELANDSNGDGYATMIIYNFGTNKICNVSPTDDAGFATNTGATGNTGPIGPIGEPGTATNTGATGNTGPTGGIGNTGNTGATGPASVWSQNGTSIYYSSGNVGINTSTPSYNLDINGSLKTSSDSVINGLSVGRGGGNQSTNTAIGYQALFLNVGGTGTTSVGYNSMYNNTASNNTAIGVNAGINNTTGTNNTFIGYGATGATDTASNQITLGNSEVTTLRCAVTTITSLSDQRDKKDIEQLESSLSFVEQLNPVRFIWNMRDGGKVDVPEIGFIAQDLQKVQLDTGFKVPNLVYDINPARLEASYGTLLPLLVKSIQELSFKFTQEIQELKKEITYLKERTI